MTRWVVFDNARDAGPTVAPGWRMWHATVEARSPVEARDIAHDDRVEAAFRRQLVDVGFTVVLIEWEPCCEHDLAGMPEAERAVHLDDPDACDHHYLYAVVRVPARDARQAYVQVCRQLEIEPKPAEAVTADA